MAKWIFSIIKGLEARLEYIESDASDTSEAEVIKEALKYFNDLETVEGGVD